MSVRREYFVSRDARYEIARRNGGSMMYMCTCVAENAKTRASREFFSPWFNVAPREIIKMVSRLLPLSKFRCPDADLPFANLHEISSRTQIEELIYATSYLFCIYCWLYFISTKWYYIRKCIFSNRPSRNNVNGTMWWQNFYNVIMESFLLRKLI